MLPQEYRLKRKKDFEILFADGQFVNGTLMTAKVWKIDPAKYPRRELKDTDLKIGFVVGLKISKSAVKRNRVRRQMREVVRLLLKEDRLKTGFLVALVAKPGILRATYEEIARDIEQLVKRAGLVN